jgi:hypothetical protein
MERRRLAGIKPVSSSITEKSKGAGCRVQGAGSFAVHAVHTVHRGVIFYREEVSFDV